MFNKYVWQTYLKAGGNNVVNIFASIDNDDFLEKAKNKFCGLIETLRSIYCPCKNIVDNAQRDLLQLFSDIESGDFLCGCYGLIGLSEDEEYSLDTLMELFYKGMEESALIEKATFEELSMGMEYYSTFCYLMFSDVFVPYYFKYNFNVLEKIAIEFGIELPPIPAKKDYKSRFFYYGELCNALYDFRIEYKLTPHELCAFLYDFAPQYIGGADSYIIDELPEPKSAYFVGANGDDTFLNDDVDIITPWQCSPYAEAGDIAVMYLRTPISAIDSIWKCVSDGFVDPFFYYYKCAYIAKPQKLKRVLKCQLEKDNIFKEFPLVRKNMQGINGVELLPSQYNHIMELAECDYRLEYTTTETGIELLREKDVENKLIKPLIQKLGYSENDYEQQLHLEIGNHNGMIIPDFVIKPDKKKGQQTAFAIIEAKFDIPIKEFEEVKIQARSYARQCLAKYSVIASKDKVWVSTNNDDFTEDIFVATWDELNTADAFSRLSKLIAKRK